MSQENNQEVSETTAETVAQEDQAPPRGDSDINDNPADQNQTDIVDDILQNNNNDDDDEDIDMNNNDNNNSSNIIDSNNDINDDLNELTGINDEIKVDEPIDLTHTDNDNDDDRDTVKSMIKAASKNDRMRKMDPNFVKEMAHIINLNKKYINDAGQIILQSNVAMGTYKGLPYFEISDSAESEHDMSESDDIHPFHALCFPDIWPQSFKSDTVKNWLREEKDKFFKFIYQDPMTNPEDYQRMDLFISIYIFIL